MEGKEMRLVQLPVVGPKTFRFYRSLRPIQSSTRAHFPCKDFMINACLFAVTRMLRKSTARHITSHKLDCTSLLRSRLRQWHASSQLYLASVLRHNREQHYSQPQLKTTSYHQNGRTRIPPFLVPRAAAQTSKNRLARTWD